MDLQRIELLSDQEIVILVARGEAEAFGDLVARYQRPVYRLACGMLGNTHDAEDAAQEVFVRAYKSIGGYSDYGKLWGWLRRITVNVCLKMCRPAPVTYIEESDELPGRDGDTVSESVIGSFEAQELRHMIGQLQPAYRSVIVLKYLEEMSYTEIAEILGESISNIQVRIHRAKKTLHEMREKVESDEMQRL